MASFTRSFRRGRGMKSHSAFSFFPLFMRNKMLLVVSLCFLTLCMNNVSTAAETTPAAGRLSNWNLYSRLLYFLVATSCTNIPTLDPIVLRVLSASWDWPNPQIENILEEVDHFGGIAASVQDTKERKARIQEALKQLRAGRTLADLLDDERKLFSSDPLEHLLDYTPVSHARFYRRYSEDAPLAASAGEAENQKDSNAANRNVPMRINMVTDEPKVAQSRLDDEPKPWVAAFAVGDNLGRAPVADETDAGTNSEKHSTGEDGSNDEELSGLVSSVATQPSTADDAAQLLKNWRELSVSPRDKEMSVAAGTERLLADSQTGDIANGAVQELLEEQWTAVERVRGAEESADDEELGTEDEDFEKEDDKDKLFQGNEDEEDSLVAAEVRPEEIVANEEVEKFISGDTAGLRLSQRPTGGDIAPEDIALRLFTPGKGRKTVYFQQDEEKNVSAQIRPTGAQVLDHSAQISKRLPVRASKQDQGVESVAPIEVEENIEVTANRVSSESRLPSSSVQLSRADFGQIVTVPTEARAASTKGVAPGADAGEPAKTRMQYTPLATAHHSSGNTKFNGGVDERHTHDADTSAIERPAVTLLAPGDNVSATTTPPASFKHLNRIGAAAGVTGVRTHAAGSRVEEDDIVTERIAFDEGVAVKFSAPLSSPQGRIVDAAALLSGSISMEATARLDTPLVGSSAARLLFRPLVRGTPSFIGAAAAVPPVLGTAAALLSTGTTGSPIAMGAAPVVPVGGSRVVASAAARNARESKEVCKEVSDREQLRMMFEEILEANLPTAVKEKVAKPGIPPVMKGPIAQVGRASRDEIEERKGAGRSASQQEASASATEMRLPHKQQEGAGHQTTTEKDMTPTAVDARAKLVKDAGAKTKDVIVEDIKPIATMVEKMGSEGKVGEIDKLTRTASPVTVYQLAPEKRPSAVEAGKEPVWQRVEDEKAYPASNHLSTGNVLTRPGVQQRPQQYNVPSRVVPEAATQEYHKEAEAAAYPASTGAVPAYERHHNIKEPLEENFARRAGRPPQTPPQQQPHRRFSSAQHPQPIVTETPQQQRSSLQQPQRDANHQNYQLPMRPPQDQQQRLDPWKLHHSKEDKERRQPTTEPSFAVPQRARQPPMPQPQRTEKTRSEEGASSQALGPSTKPTHAPSKDKSGYRLELGHRRPQLLQQQESSKEQEEEKQRGDEIPRETVKRETAQPDQQVGEVAKEAEGYTPNGEPEDLSLWRDVDHKASAHDRTGIAENAAGSQCMSTDNERSLEAVLGRHCHSWCTTEAMKRWDGKLPIWMFLHSTPIPAYWNSLKKGLYSLYEKHRPAVEEMLQESWSALKRMRIQAERRAKQMLDVAAARNHQFQQQYPDLWLAAVWTIAVLLLCRLITGRFFFLLQLFLSAMAYTFCCHRRPYRDLNVIDCSALATVNALLDDRQIKWLLTQTRKTSFLCEALKGRFLDGSLPRIEAAGTPPALGGDAAPAAGGGGGGGEGAVELEGTIASILGYSAMNINAGQRAGPATQTEQQQIIWLLQKISQQQQQVTQALHGVQRRIESVEMGQRLYESKLQEAAASYSAMFESNSLHQVDSNFAILKLTMHLLQKVDPGTAAETVEQLQSTFLAHTKTINETMAAIKARQLRALFGRHRAQCEREMYEKALAAAADRSSPAGATAAGPPPPPPGVAAVTGIPAPRPTASLSFPVAGPPPSPAQLTASASLSITSGTTRSLPYSAAAGSPPTPAAVPKPEDIGSLMPPQAMVLLSEPPQQSPATLALSPFGETERHLPWLVRQLLNIQQSLPELLLQHGEFHAQLVLTRKVGDTCQQIVLSPEKGIYNRSDGLRKALGPISAAVNQIFTGDACSGSSNVSSSRRGILSEGDIRSSPASAGSAPESSRADLFAPPSGAAQQTREDEKGVSLDASAAAAGSPPLAAAAPTFTDTATWSNAEPKQLLNEDVEQKTGQLAEGPAAETPLAAETSPPEMTPAPGASSAAGSGEKAFSPVKQQAARRSVADLFGEAAAPEPATRGSRRLSLGECFSPESKVLSRSAEKAEDTSNDHPETLTSSQTPFVTRPGSAADTPQRPASLLAASFSASLFLTPAAGSAASAAPAAFTPHFPPADASAFETESSATAPLLPSPPTSPPSPPAVPAGPSSLLSSPFSGPATAACAPSLSTALFPPLPNGASVRPPPPISTSGAPLSASSMLTSDATSLPADSSINEVSSLPAATRSAGASSPPFVPGQSESGNPPLLTALTGVAAAPGILPSPPSARSFIAAAATSASTSPFPLERKGSGAGLPPLIPPPPSSPFNTPGGPDSRRGSQDDILVSNGGNAAAASFPPPPPSAYSQEQMTATEGMSSITLGTPPPPPPPSGGGATTTALLTPLHTGGGIIAGTSPPIPPPPPTGSGPSSPPPPPPGGISTPPHFPSAVPTPLSRPPSALHMGERGPQELAAPQATDALEGGSRPPTPLAPPTMPSGFGPPPPAFCGNGYSGAPLLSLPRRVSGSYPRPAESVTPTMPATAYQRPTRFQRERREPPKIQAATNPFAVPPPPSSAANLQQFGGGSGGATPSHNAA